MLSCLIPMPFGSCHCVLFIFVLFRDTKMVCPCALLLHSAYTNVQCRRSALLLLDFYLHHLHQMIVTFLSDTYFSSLVSAICRTQNLPDGDDQALLDSVCVARQSLRRYGGVTWCVITLSSHPVGIHCNCRRYRRQKRGLLISSELVVMLADNQFWWSWLLRPHTIPCLAGNSTSLKVTPQRNGYLGNWAFPRGGTRRLSPFHGGRYLGNYYISGCG